MKRLLSATPKELLSCSGRELLSMIRMSEGRCLRAGARIRCANLIDGVSNAEVAAAFGADIINLDTYDIFASSVPGLPSKSQEDDAIYADIQVPAGKGYHFKELETLIGRPISLLLLLADDAALAEKSKAVYGNIIADEKTLQKCKEEGVRWLQIDSFDEHVNLPSAIKSIRSTMGEDIIIQVAKSHGTGILHQENTKALIQEQDIKDLIDAGVDIIGFPAPGSYPGWDIAQCKRYVELAHTYGAVVVLGVHTSQEGASPQTLEQIALYAKMCGADMHDLGDCGFNENMIDPMNILRYGVAIRGKRHQYRRMAISGMR